MLEMWHLDVFYHSLNVSHSAICSLSHKPEVNMCTNPFWGFQKCESKSQPNVWTSNLNLHLFCCTRLSEVFHKQDNSTHNAKETCWCNLKYKQLAQPFFDPAPVILNCIVASINLSIHFVHFIILGHFSIISTIKYISHVIIRKFVFNFEKERYVQATTQHTKCS